MKKADDLSSKDNYKKENTANSSCVFCCKQVSELTVIIKKKNQVIDKLYLKHAEEVSRRRSCEMKNNILIAVLATQFIISLISSF